MEISSSQGRKAMSQVSGVHSIVGKLFIEILTSLSLQTNIYCLSCTWELCQWGFRRQRDRQTISPCHNWESCHAADGTCSEQVAGNSLWHHPYPKHWCGPVVKYGLAALDWSVVVYLPFLYGLDLGCMSREVVPLVSTVLPCFCDLISLRSSGDIFSL